MREIKFRGRTPDGKWIYGDLIHSGTDTIGILEADAPCLEAITDVIPESVGQFTGLHDKDGKEIYEGDIIDFYSEFWRELEYPYRIDPKHFYRLVVVWNVRDVGFGLISLGEALLPPEAQSPTGITQISDSYLIGNIHDNSELLKSL